MESEQFISYNECQHRDGDVLRAGHLEKRKEHV